MYFVYILSSESAKKSYVGITNDLDRRLAEHNSGKHFYTKRHTPWKIVYTEEHTSQLDAHVREVYFKTAAGRRFMKKTIFRS